MAVIPMTASFARYTADDIGEFAANATRPIRARQSRSRPDLICLYQISHFEHLLEKLGFIFYDNQQRRRDAHLAIETSIRPMLDKEKSDIKTACITTDLHTLVEQREWTCSPAQPANGSTNQVATTHEKKPELIYSRTVGNAILVPEGISIAVVKSSDVIAERIIRVADFMPGSGNTDLSLIIPADNDHKTDDDGSVPTVNLEQQIVGEANAADANLIVIEMPHENEEEKDLQNWAAAFSAAKHVRQESRGKKSIMLVPAAETLKGFLTEGPTRRRKEEVLGAIKDSLNNANSKKASIYAAENPYTH